MVAKVVFGLAALVGSTEAFMAGGAAPLRTVAVTTAAAPVMSEERSSRRALLASALLLAPAAANAMTIPGFNAPGLVKATPQTGARPAWTSIRDEGTNHFWSPKGIMDSVPKVKGIITPKTPVK